jgi:hypothetical protein
VRTTYHVKTAKTAYSNSITVAYLHAESSSNIFLLETVWSRNLSMHVASALARFRLSSIAKRISGFVLWCSIQIMWVRESENIEFKLTDDNTKESVCERKDVPAVFLYR